MRQPTPLYRDPVIWLAFGCVFACVLYMSRQGADEADSAAAPSASHQPRQGVQVVEAADECPDAHTIRNLDTVAGRWELYLGGLDLFSAKWAETDSQFEGKPWPYYPYQWHLSFYEDRHGVKCDFFPELHEDDWRIGVCEHYRYIGPDWLVDATEPKSEQIHIVWACNSLCVRVGNFQTCTPGKTREGG
jgi:hypothetical protein